MHFSVSLFKALLFSLKIFFQQACLSFCLFLLKCFTKSWTNIPGYNHPALKKVLTSEDVAISLINRPSLSRFPPVDFSSSLRRSLMQVAPPSMEHVCTMMCGSCSNENAIKAAFIRYMVRTVYIYFTGRGVTVLIKRLLWFRLIYV